MDNKWTFGALHAPNGTREHAGLTRNQMVAGCWYMDGYETTRRIRETESGGGKHTPVIAYRVHRVPPIPKGLTRPPRRLPAQSSSSVTRRMVDYCANFGMRLNRQVRDQLQRLDTPRGEPTPAAAVR